MMGHSHRQGKRKGLHRSGQMSEQSRLLGSAAILLLAMTVLSVLSFSATRAEDQPLPPMTINYQNGTITAIHEKTLDIDGRTYGVVPEVIMLDKHGKTLDPGRLMVSAEVKFHVKKEQNNMIDQMVVTLPF